MKLITPKTYLFITIGAVVAYVLGFFLRGFLIDIIEIEGILDYAILFVVLILTISPLLLFFYGIYLLHKSTQKHTFIIIGLVLNILMLAFLELSFFLAILSGPFPVPSSTPVPLETPIETGVLE